MHAEFCCRICPCCAGGQLVKDELGISLDKADDSILGLAAKVGSVC